MDGFYDKNKAQQQQPSNPYEVYQQDNFMNQSNSKDKNYL